MADQDTAFLAAICAAPDDDAPRLVYADHLLESREPARRERGEFIVAQCEVARLPRNTDGWRRAKQREIELGTSTADDTKAWGVSEWSRGFPRTIRCAPKKLARTWRKLIGLPIREIAFFERDARSVQPTLGELGWVARTFPQIERVRFKSLFGSATLDPKALRDLADGDHTIAWKDGRLPHASIRAAVTTLYLADAVLGGLAGGLAPFANEPFPQLEDLTLRSADPDLMMAMSARHLKRLTWHAEGDAKLARLSKLSKLALLEELDVNIILDAELAATIASASSLASLALRHDTTDDGLARFEPPPSLRRLILHFAAGRWYDLSPATARHRLPRGRYPALERLELGRFLLDAQFGALEFPALTALELTECIFDLGAMTNLDGPYRPSFLRCGLNTEAERALRARWPDAVVR